MKIKTKLTLEQIQDSENIADDLTNDELKEIGSFVVETYDIDKQSRKKWETKMEAAMDLALQITEEKTSPWKGAANVKFPLLTIASLQFASRAYPALVKAPDLVKYRVASKSFPAPPQRGQRITVKREWGP